MIDYEYTNVLVEHIHDPDDEDTWIESSLSLTPCDDKILLTYRSHSFGHLTISFEFYIEDWREPFEKIIEERIHIYRKARSAESFSPRSLKIQGNRNPLVNMIIYACTSPQTAKLSLRLIDCSQDQLELLLESNNNFTLKSAVKYSQILDDLLDKAFIRVKHLIDTNGIRLSELMKVARKVITSNQEWADKLSTTINAGKNKVVFSEGPYLVIEVHDPEEFENIYEPVEYAVLDSDNTHHYISGKLLACAVGEECNSEYSFDLTFSHVDWPFTCSKLSEVPKRAFDAIQSYMDMTS